MKIIFKNLYKFFPDLQLVFNRINKNTYKMNTLKKMHHVLSNVFLSFNTLNVILFKNKKEIFRKVFISSYKVIILNEFLIEQYLFLCLSLKDDRIDNRILLFFLFKSFILFCNKNNLYCPFNIKKLNFETFISKKFYLMITTNAVNYQNDFQFESIKKYLVLEYINQSLLNYLN